MGLFLFRLIFFSCSAVNTSIDTVISDSLILSIYLVETGGLFCLVQLGNMSVRSFVACTAGVRVCSFVCCHVLN